MVVWAQTILLSELTTVTREQQHKGPRTQSLSQPITVVKARGSSLKTSHLKNNLENRVLAISILLQLCLAQHQVKA